MMQQAREELFFGQPQNPLVLGELDWMVHDFEPKAPVQARLLFDQYIAALPANIDGMDDNLTCGTLALVATIAANNNYLEGLPRLLDRLREHASRSAF